MTLLTYRNHDFQDQAKKKREMIATCIYEYLFDNISK